MIGFVQRDRPPSRLLEALIGLGKDLVLLVDRSGFRATPVLRRPFSSQSEPFLLYLPLAVIRVVVACSAISRQARTATLREVERG
jgi:hypothetical protein